MANSIHCVSEKKSNINMYVWICVCIKIQSWLQFILI
jgi:hypothetical protein